MKWIRDFLSDRRAYATVVVTRSKTCTMCEGLPQGSVLAPMEFESSWLITNYEPVMILNGIRVQVNPHLIVNL